MRMIDADALLESMPIQYPSTMNAIAGAPTIDPEQHGKWIAVPSSDMSTGKAYKCSVCAKMRYGSYMPAYCQCCGARMDGTKGEKG